MKKQIKEVKNKGKLRKKERRNKVGVRRRRESGVRKMAF